MNHRPAGLALSRVFALIIAMTVLLPGAVLAARQQTDGRSPDGVAEAAGSKPKPTATGHLHLLAAPARVADSRSGKGLPKAPLAADATASVPVAGVGGLPNSGILALAVVITTYAPAGPTSVRVGPSNATPILVTVGGTSSAFAIVPVSTGAIPLRNGAHATNITVDVVGWFSAADQTGNAGLLRSLAGRTVATVTVAASSSRTVKVSGKAGIPSTHVSAALLRLDTDASGAGTLAIGPTAAGTSGRVSQAYRSGATSDLALVKISSAGSIVIRNSGTHSVTVGDRCRGLVHRRPRPRCLR